MSSDRDNLSYKIKSRPTLREASVRLWHIIFGYYIRPRSKTRSWNVGPPGHTNQPTKLVLNDYANLQYAWLVLSDRFWRVKERSISMENPTAKPIALQ